MKKIIYIILCLFCCISIYADTYTTKFIQGNAGTISATKLNDNNYQWRLTATPFSHYDFLYWLDSDENKFYSNPLQITIDSSNVNYAIQAAFLAFNSYIDNWTNNRIIIKSIDTYLSDFHNGVAEVYVNDVKITEADNRTNELDNGVWDIDATNLLNNNNNAGKYVHVINYNECDEISSIIDTIVPYIVSTTCNSNSISIPNNADIYVLENCTLTINSNVTTSGILVIHPNAKVLIESGKTLFVNTIIMQGNGITNKYPNLSINGTATISTGIINYDYTIDYNAYYPLAIPYNTNGKDVYNPINKSQPSYCVYRYNTETRYTGASGWEEFDYNIFKPGRGFITYGVPMKWNGNYQKDAIIRFPMAYNAQENSNKTHTYIFSTTDTSYKIYNKNWNMIGNPYLSEFAINNTSESNIQEGFYYFNDETGEFEIDTETYPSVRYITYSTDNFRSYHQERLKGFVFKPFNSYFIQTVNGNSLTFSKNDRIKNTPKRIQSLFDNNDIEIGIKIQQNDIEDNAGFLFGNDYTEEYELNADLVKEFGNNSKLSLYSLQISNDYELAFQALPNNYLNYPIQIGYKNNNGDNIIFKLDESYEINDNIEGVWLTDNILNNQTNLLYNNYEFEPTNNDDNRFYITITKKSNTDTPTDIENIIDSNNIKIYNILGYEIQNCNQLNQNEIYIFKNNNKSWKEIYR